jgi:hypothetical protein
MELVLPNSVLDPDPMMDECRLRACDSRGFIGEIPCRSAILDSSILFSLSSGGTVEPTERRIVLAEVIPPLTGARPSRFTEGGSGLRAADLGDSAESGSAFAAGNADSRDGAGNGMVMGSDGDPPPRDGGGITSTAGVFAMFSIDFQPGGSVKGLRAVEARFGVDAFIEEWLVALEAAASSVLASAALLRIGLSGSRPVREDGQVSKIQQQHSASTLYNSTAGAFFVGSQPGTYQTVGHRADLLLSLRPLSSWPVWRY